MQFARKFSVRPAGLFRFIAKSIQCLAAFVLLKPLPHKDGQIKLESFMTTQESKLAKELERRLQEHALETKKGIYGSEVKTERVGTIIRSPLRIHHQMIQRAQFYTGDA